VTTIDAETAKVAENHLLCVLSAFGVERRERVTAIGAGPQKMILLRVLSELCV
jgi:hypothetical protein